MAEAPDINVDELRRRARRRLLGAIVLALAAAVIVPMLLESDPEPLGEDVFGSHSARGQRQVRQSPVGQGRENEQRRRPRAKSETAVSLRRTANLRPRRAAPEPAAPCPPRPRPPAPAPTALSGRRDHLAPPLRNAMPAAKKSIAQAEQKS